MSDRPSKYSDASRCPFDLREAQRLQHAGKSFREIATKLAVAPNTVISWLKANPYVEPPKPKPVAKPVLKPTPPMAAPDLKRQIENAVRGAAQHLSETERRAVEQTVLQSLGEKPLTPAELGVIGLDGIKPGESPTVWVTSNPRVAMICEGTHPTILMKVWHPSLASHPVFALAQVIWHFCEPMYARVPDDAWTASKRLSESLMADPQISDHVRECYDITHVPSEAIYGPRVAPIEPPPMFNGPKRETYHFDLDNSESTPGSATFAF
jgi:hypothetical protein